MFGEALRFARERAGLKQDELGTVLHCHRTQITRYESGKRAMDRRMVELADEELDMGGLLVRLWERVDWHADIEHPDWFQSHVDRESEAVAVRTFHIAVVDGLLQCREYAEAVFASSDAAGNRDLIRQRTMARLARQERFLDPDGPLLLAILDESAIRTVYGGPGVMRRQMEHLLAMAKRPNIGIRITPFAPRGASLTVSMMLLDMPDGRTYTYSESLDRGHASDSPETVARHRRSYDLLTGEALSVTESLTRMADALEEFRNDEERARRDHMAQEQLQRRERRRLHRGSPRIPRSRPRT
ncbi:helix-turn-helix domain-containing protein [Streptomyces sp. NRRL WC-3742]|uniref:helix-turn-helix domain-containing protein n=1 Tax=Streptomyces sp. NRRL WC-3742 TaxID=1463934 RepID=UPI00131A78B8|nr:helix-turn-helix transcriptional regulator [Streptomyces sp. NRRL WC-3742]